MKQSDTPLDALDTALQTVQANVLILLAMCSLERRGRPCVRAAFADALTAANRAFLDAELAHVRWLTDASRGGES